MSSAHRGGAAVCLRCFLASLLYCAGWCLAKPAVNITSETGTSAAPQRNETTTGPALGADNASRISGTAAWESTIRTLSVDGGDTTTTLGVRFPQSQQHDDYRAPKELPLPLIIASPVAAVSIIVLLCVAYYCHSAQLDARARQLALKFAVISSEPVVKVVPSSLSSPSTPGDAELLRKSSLRPSMSLSTRSPTPVPTPSGSKRGSINWSVIGDQEVITYTAARRHSTFIL